jgi:uncharacterized protein (TIGR03435 family)
VIDQTGLAGLFDLDITYVPETSEMPFPAANVGGAGGPIDGPPAGGPASQGGPSMFEALRSQLGLRLEGSRAPVDVLIVDRIQPPSDN